MSGTAPKIVVTLEQSSDLHTWNMVASSGTSYEINAAPQLLRTSGAGMMADRVVQPYIRLTYDGTGGATDQKVVFSARITLIDA